MFTVDTAAEILDVSPSHIWKLIREGDLSRVRIGNRTLVRDDELAALVERNTVRGDDA